MKLRLSMLSPWGGCRCQNPRQAPDDAIDPSEGWSRTGVEKRKEERQALPAADAAPVAGSRDAVWGYVGAVRLPGGRGEKAARCWTSRGRNG
jgi:hypothetical protein